MVLDFFSARDEQRPRTWWSSLRWSPMVIYVILWLVDQSFRERIAHKPKHFLSSVDNAIVEALKLLIAALVWYRTSKTTYHPTGSRPIALGSVVWESSPGAEQQGFRDNVVDSPVDDFVLMEELQRSPRPGIWQVGTAKSILLSFSAAGLWAIHSYMLAASLRIFDAVIVHTVSALSIILVLGGTHLFGMGSQTTSRWQLALLQVTSSIVAASNLSSVEPIPFFSYFALSALALSAALSVLLVDLLYRLHDIDSLPVVNITIFTSGLCIYLSMSLSRIIFASNAMILYPSNVLFYTTFRLVIRAALDYTALSIIRNCDALLERLLASAAFALLVLITAVTTRTVSPSIFFGGVVALWAAFRFTQKSVGDDDDEETVKHDDMPLTLTRKSLFGLLLMALSGFIAHGAVQVSLSEPHNPPFSVKDSLFASEHPLCKRKPLSFGPLRPPEERAYHAFDDVLLVVFFSHARYDVNLDYYREVYAEYFPNMVFIGPGSREDAGFYHSYDVLVDSYESDEDLSDPDWYKMAGRMAHHMLYTALREYPCYDGYLWAPFDTLLNVPRLQQFDQDLFWYHSPFGQYVPNVALGSPEDNWNSSRHAPPANISPDPALNLTEGWRGWGPDWWWGDPHVGVSECMPAFNKVPEFQRRRLQMFLDGKTRFIGGSADTMYIPGRHRELFMDTLGLFLETQCFLEIATPTTLHLVVPPDEPILFVDHWWIWEPPLNATFVRNQWTAGYEVDTFHTFHWGDRGDDGVWRGNPDHIEDVRQLLEESAVRQKVDFPGLE